MSAVSCSLTHSHCHGPRPLFTCVFTHPKILHWSCDLCGTTHEHRDACEESLNLQIISLSVGQPLQLLQEGSEAPDRGGSERKAFLCRMWVCLPIVPLARWGTCNAAVIHPLKRGAFTSPVPRQFHQRRSGGLVGSWTNIYKNSGKLRLSVITIVRCWCGGSQAIRGEQGAEAEGLHQLLCRVCVCLECLNGDSATFRVDETHFNHVDPVESCG